MNDPHDLKKMPLGKLFRHYLIASVISMLIASIHRVVDTVFIGRGVGSLGISAMNAIIPLLASVWALMILITMGGSTAYSISMGKGDKDEAKNIFYTSNFLMGFLVLFFIIFGLGLIEPICLFLGCDYSTLPYATGYLKIQLYFLPALALSGMTSAFIKNDGNPRLVMYGIIFSSVTNIILNYIFIFMFNWGIEGASLATGFAEVIGVLVLSIHFVKKKANLDLKFSHIKLKWTNVVSIVKVGLPPFFAEISFSVALFFMNRVVGGLVGQTGIASVGIMFSVIDMIYIMIYGVASSMQPIVSFNFGAGEHKRVWDTLILAIKISFVISLVLTIIGFINAEFIVKIINDQDLLLIAMATKLLRYNFLTMPITAISTSTQIFYQSIGKAKIATILTVMRNAGFVIVVLYIMKIFFGIAGVWMTYPIADIFSVIVYGICLKSLHKRYRHLIHHQLSFIKE